MHIDIHGLRLRLGLGLRLGFRQGLRLGLMCSRGTNPAKQEILVPTHLDPSALLPYPSGFPPNPASKEQLTSHQVMCAFAMSPITGLLFLQLGCASL